MKKHLKKIRRIVVIGLLSGVIAIFVINRYVITIGEEKIQGIYGQYSTIVEDLPPMGEGLFPEPYVGVIFGASVSSTGKPSPILKERIDKVYELYIQGIIGKILISAYDKDKNYLEATSIRVYLIGLGVPSNDILMDSNGYDTLASIQNLKKYPVSKLILVSQQYHLYRIMYYTMYINQEFTYIGIPSDYKPTKNEKYLNSREVLARVKAFIEMTALHRNLYDELEELKKILI